MKIFLMGLLVALAAAESGSGRRWASGVRRGRQTAGYSYGAPQSGGTLSTQPQPQAGYGAPESGGGGGQGGFGGNGGGNQGGFGGSGGGNQGGYGGNGGGNQGNFGGNGGGGQAGFGGYGGNGGGQGGGGSGGQHSLKDTIPGGGEPGVDYPTLASVPDTGFSCDQYQTGGYYADINEPALCQVFHICYDDRMDSFLCPNGTLFNQKYFVCDWWYNVDCAASESFFQLNEEIGKTDASGNGNGNGNGANTGYGAPSSGGNGFGNGGSGGSVNSGYGAPSGGARQQGGGGQRQGFTQVSSFAGGNSGVTSAQASSFGAGGGFQQAGGQPSGLYGTPSF